MKKTVIIGAGPTGLGAAWRLQELGHSDWALLEAGAGPGGLASSFVDGQGFTWDIGGHVQFSHYDYFDRVMDELLGPDGWLHHRRESWVWMRGRFVPYPLQNNIHRLPAEELEKCLAGFASLAPNLRGTAANFREWVLATFGQGLAEAFMLPYNFKVWGFPPEQMNALWVGARVAVPNPDRIRQNLRHQQDDVSWGPNSTFSFPRQGGTGAIWKACARRLPQQNLFYNAKVAQVDLGRRQVATADGRKFSYDRLVSTLPLDQLIRLSGQTQFAALAAQGLLHSSSNIVGLGLRGQPVPELAGKNWIYFPENNCPFYRVTVFSNYSPHNVPDSRQHWSLMAEVSESPHKPVDQATLPEEVILGALNTGLIKSRQEIISTWSYRARHGYPVPGLHRERALAEIIPFFENQGVFSRGRFGFWKYEVSNQDHSFMQGVEVVERLANGRQEVTVQNPDRANSKKHPWPFETWQ